MSEDTTTQDSGRTLVIHAGFAKTGTSALQVAFAQNVAWLAEQGIYYPPMGAMDAASAGEVTSGNGAELGSHLCNLLQRPEIVTHTLELLEASAAPFALVSSEFFQGAKPDRLRDFVVRARELGYRVRAVFFLRAWHDWLWSAYVQNVRNHAIDMEFAAWVRRSGVAKLFPKAIATWDAVLGAEHVQLLNYDAMRDDIFASFLREAFGMEATVQATRRPGHVNRSLVGSEIEMMLRFNRISRNEAQGKRLASQLLETNPGHAEPPEPDRTVVAWLGRHVADDLAAINARIRPKPLEIRARRATKTEGASAPSVSELNQTVLLSMYNMQLNAGGAINALRERIEALAGEIGSLRDAMDADTTGRGKK